MSELTICNRCTLESMRHSQPEGVRIVLRRKGANFGLGGIAVLAVPKGETPDIDKHRVAWFMELTERCCC